MRIAVPVMENRLSQHFGHAPQVALFTVDPVTRAITGKELLEAAPHEHGSLPRFMQQHGADLVIAGGIGAGAVQFLQRLSIQLVAGAPSDEPEAVVTAYLNGTLVTGNGSCNHDHGHDHHHHHQHRHG